MVKLWLDSMVFKVFSNLSNSVTLLSDPFIFQHSAACAYFPRCKEGLLLFFVGCFFSFWVMKWWPILMQ
mgnify:CR=1 FL=1